MKRGEALVVLGLVCVGLAWSWTAHVYNLRWAEARLVVALVTLGASLGVMWVGLAVARVPREARTAAAVSAILPWNALLLSQLAYVGYLFIPLEVLASTLLLRRRTSLPRWAAFTVAVLARAAAFGVTIAATTGARRLFMR